MYLDQFLVIYFISYLKKKTTKKYEGACETCMIVWIREPKRRRLTRIKPEPELKYEKMAGQERNERALNKIFYPPRSTLSSCFNLPALSTNMNLKLEPHYIQMLPKFTGLEDAYLLLREFEEVCNMIHLHNVHIDVVKLRFVPFGLKDNAKRWMYSLPASSISNWNDFVKVFLRKYFSNGKTVKLRNKINQFI